MSTTIEIDEEEYQPIPRSVYLVISFFVVLMFLTIGLAGNPELSSTAIWILLAIYLVVIATKDFSQYSWLIALAIVSLHIGSIISYYSKPLILPFIIIERSGNYSSINLDFVQIIIIYEIIRRLPIGKAIKPQTENQDAGAKETPR